MITTLTDTMVRAVREKWGGDRDSFINSLGKPDFEEEYTQLGTKLIVLRDDFVRTAEAPGLIVVGRKGTGKTAVAQYAANAPQSGNRQLRLSRIVDAELKLSDYSRAEPNTDWNPADVSTWIDVYVLLIMELLASTMRGMALTSDEQASVRKVVLDRGNAKPDLIERLVSCLGPIGTAMNLGGFLKFNQKLSMPQMRGALDELTKATPVFLYLDNFDGIPRTSGRSPATVCQAAIEAAKKLQAVSANIRICVLLREDYWLLAQNDWALADKLSSPPRYLYWEKDELREAVHRRLRHAISLALGEEYDRIQVSQRESWRPFFPPTVTIRPRNEPELQSEGLDYLVHRTGFTPRDALTFMQHVIQQTKRFPASQTELEDGEREYAKNKIEFIDSEFSSLCKNISQLIGCFSNGPMKYLPRDAMERIRPLVGPSGLVEPSTAVMKKVGHDRVRAAVATLFLVGFLEERVYKTDGSYTFSHVYMGASRSIWHSFRTDDDIKWGIRSAFRLGLQTPHL